MSQNYRDYVWRNGLPYGISPCSTETIKQGISYKIASDPYHKRVSLEKHLDGDFAGVIYDSALFDFRHIKLGEQTAWQKIKIRETDQMAVCHIRNQDDRLVLIEEYQFEQDLCRECRAYSPFGPLLFIQNICYELLNDSFNGVILKDNNQHVVMSKHYSFDLEMREFTEMLEEKWVIAES
jgi:hypothetical protein